MSPTVARLRYARALDTVGPEHPRTRALRGRMLAYYAVPQRDSTSIEAVAWHRATGAQPGYLNRRQRRQTDRP